MEPQLPDRLLEVEFSLETGNYRQADQLLNKLDKAGIPEYLLADYHFLFGRTQLELRRYQDSRTHLLEALQRLEADPEAEPLRVERVRNWVGLSYYRQHRYSQAIEYFRACREAALSGRLTDRGFTLKVLTNLGSAYSQLQDPRNAIQSYQEALNLARSGATAGESPEAGENDLSRAAAYWGMGIVYRHSGELSKATACLWRSAAIYERSQARSFAARARSLLGAVLVDREQYAQALEVLEQAHRHTPPDDHITLALIYLNQSYAFYGLNDYPSALNQVKMCLAETARQPDDLLTGQALAQQARLELAQAQTGQQAGRSLDLFRQAIKTLEQTEDRAILRRVYYRYAKALKQQGHHADALDALQTANSLNSPAKKPEQSGRQVKDN